MSQPFDEHGPDHDCCAYAIAQVQAFLHHEMCEADADVIRRHLDGCEDCLENFDIEEAITALIRRCVPARPASAELRMRIVRMTIQRDC